MSNHRAQLNKAYQKKVVEKLDNTVRLTALSVFAEIVRNTPVDTGRARANWNVDINAVDVTLQAPGHDNASAANAAVTRYKVNDTIFISNNLPYIRRLNEGYSQQSPTSFVQAAVQVGKRKGKELARR